MPKNKQIYNELDELLAKWEHVRGKVGARESYYTLPEDRARPPSTAIDSWLQECLDFLGVEAPLGEKWTGHSLRKGAASAGSARGVTLDKICFVGGWSIQSKAVWDYIDPTCPDSEAGRLFFGWLRPSV